ncbi:MAG: 4Fe-4S binding protein [Candidatus Riflebacteria bacterium]|nr:4Fe-4S binding protein [Candidatus Riflebacteria bacterium]
MSKWVINENLCKGCGICISRCPLKILAFADHLTSKGVHPAGIIDEAKCTSCAICARSCPDVAIEIYKEEK